MEKHWLVYLWCFNGSTEVIVFANSDYDTVNSMWSLVLNLKYFIQYTVKARKTGHSENGRFRRTQANRCSLRPLTNRHFLQFIYCFGPLSVFLGYLSSSHVRRECRPIAGNHWLNYVTPSLLGLRRYPIGPLIARTPNYIADSHSGNKISWVLGSFLVASSNMLLRLGDCVSLASILHFAFNWYTPALYSLTSWLCKCLGVITCLVRFNFVNNMLFLWYENYLWTQIHVAIEMCHTQNQHLGIYEQHFFLQ